MTTEWFYFKGDQRIGPVTLEQLKSLAVSGDIEPADLVWNNGMAAPQPASTLNGTPTENSAPVSPPPLQSAVADHAEAPAMGADLALNAQKQISRAAAAMSTFIATAKSAAQLAAKQTEKTKLTTITLRTVYRPLGKHCYESQEYRADFPDLFGQLDAIQHELATLAAGHTEQPSSQSFGDKAKAMAGNVMQAAQSQKLSMQQSSLFNALGKAVYERHQDESGPSTVTAPIAACLSRVTELDADISRLSSEGNGSWITPKRLAIAGAVAVCLFMMAVVGKLGTTTNGSISTTNDDTLQNVAATVNPSTFAAPDPQTTKGDLLQNVFATDLYAAFKSDPKAAERRYKGKWLAVSGEVGTRDNAPKNYPGTIMMGLIGSSETDAYVACYFAREDESMLQLLNSTPQPPIIGKCVGAAQSEYAKAGQTLIEVQMTDCNILPLSSAQPTLKQPAAPSVNDDMPGGETPTREELISLVYKVATISSLKHTIGNGPSPEEFIELTHEAARQLGADKYNHSRFLLTLQPDRDKTTVVKGVNGRVLRYGPETVIFMQHKRTGRHTFVSCSIDGGEQKMNTSGN